MKVPSAIFRLLGVEGDEKRDGTVSNQKFVSLLRLLDLDLGEGATLELLRKTSSGCSSLAARRQTQSGAGTRVKARRPRWRKIAQGGIPSSLPVGDLGCVGCATCGADMTCDASASPVENAAWSEDDDIVMRGLRHYDVLPVCDATPGTDLRMLLPGSKWPRSGDNGGQRPIRYRTPVALHARYELSNTDIGCAAIKEEELLFSGGGGAVSSAILLRYPPMSVLHDVWY
eukprot:3032358-Rhodomonas_salina.2